MSGDWTCPAGHRWHLAGETTVDAAPTCPECGGPGSPFDTRATLDPAGAAVIAPPAAVRVPGFAVEREIGRGAMGVVYLAWEERLRRPVALKMILAGAHASDRDHARFRREVEAVAALQHPNIVQIYAVGEAGGLAYCALEYVPGGTLAENTRGRPVASRDSAALAEALARAVQYAHDRGVIHRDLKPANVLLGEGGIPKVADFGLAKRLNSATGPTQTGAILGTPAYMAPEQAGDGKSAGPAADVYALGAILYELLTGRPPFRAATPLDTMRLVASEEPVPPRRLRPAVPRDLETIALKCLRKAPTRRYASADELAEDLRRWRAGEPIQARRQGWGEWSVRQARRHRGWLIAAGSAGLTLLLALQMQPSAHSPDPPRAPPEPPTQAKAGLEAVLATLSPEAVDQIKNAIVMVRTTRPGGAICTGSGFLAGEPGVVVTPSEVLGMGSALAAPPERVEVILNADTPGQRTLTARVLSVDHTARLACLQVPAAGLAPPGMALRFLASGEAVARLLRERVVWLRPGQAVAAGSGAAVPIAARLADPLNRLAELSLDVWTGPPGPARPAVERLPPSSPGDTPRRTDGLTRRAGDVAGPGEDRDFFGRIELPPLPVGHVYWAQPRTRTAGGEERWGEAVVLVAPGATVDAREALLLHSTFRLGQVHRTVLDTRQLASLDVNGQVVGQERSLQAMFAERTQALDPPAGSGQVRLQYLDVKCSDADAGSAINQLGGALDAFKQLVVEASVTTDGRYQSPKANYAQVPVAARPILRQFNQQILEALDTLTLGLPNKIVAANHTWETVRPCALGASATRRPAVLRLRYQYVGTRTRAGREEAVIELAGTIAPDAGGPRGNGPAPVKGTARGAAALDLQTGLAVLARLEAEVTTEMPVGGVAAPAALYLEWLLRRGLDGSEPPAAADADTFLPNRTIFLRPVVPVR
jgi:serine/threonine protein kinase